VRVRTLKFLLNMADVGADGAEIQRKDGKTQGRKGVFLSVLASLRPCVSIRS